MIMQPIITGKHTLTFALVFATQLLLAACGAERGDGYDNESEIAGVDGRVFGDGHLSGPTHSLMLTSSFEHSEGFNLVDREVVAIEPNVPIDDTELDVLFELVCRGSNVLVLRSTVSVCQLDLSTSVDEIDADEAAHPQCTWSNTIFTGVGAEPTAVLFRRDGESEAVAAVVEASGVAAVTLTFASTD